MSTNSRTASKARSLDKTRQGQVTPAERAIELLRSYDRAVEELARVERTPNPRPGEVWDPRIERAVEVESWARNSLIKFILDHSNPPKPPTDGSYRDDAELLAGSVQIGKTILIAASGHDGQPLGGFLVRLDATAIRNL